MTVRRTSVTDLERARLDEVVRLRNARDAGVEGLMALLEDRSWSVRRSVVAALAAIGDAALAPLLRSLEHDRKSETRIAATVDALVASISDVEAVLPPLIACGDTAVVADVAQILGRRRSARAVPTLIALLSHTDDNVAVAAIEALGRTGGRAAVDALVGAVESDYFFRTYPAIEVLGRSGDPRAVAPLARLLDKSQYTLEAARALGRTADKRAVAPLCELLSSATETNVRVAAVALAELAEAHRERYGNADTVRDAIRQAAAPSTVRRVVRALMGGETAERIAMCVVLGALRDEAAAHALTPLLDVPAMAQAAAEALRQLGHAADEQLCLALREGDSARRRVLLPMLARTMAAHDVLRCLDDDDANVRALACDALARIGDASVVSVLFEHLGDPSPRVCQAATGAIQSLGSHETSMLAMRAARSDSPVMRRAALRILSYFGTTAALDIFEEAVADVDERVRDVAIAGLAFLEHPRAHALLLTLAVDASERSRAAAMRALGQSTPSEDVIATLLGGLHDARAWVRYYACQSLGKLGAREIASAVAEHLNDSAGQVRVAAVEALSHLKSPVALEALRGCVTSRDADVQRAALIGLGLMQSVESLPLLLEACKADDPSTRLIALSALRALAMPEALGTIAAAVGDDDESVRIAAIGLLADWPSSEATRLLIEAMHDHASRARIAHALATPTHGRIAGLLTALETADDELAPVLASVLGRVDPEGHTGAIFDALRLPNAASRKAAAAMLAARGTREALDALKTRSEEDPSDEVRRVCSLFLAQ